MRARLVASTGDTYSASVGAVLSVEEVGNGVKPDTLPYPDGLLLGSTAGESDLFKSAQWSPDGTCVLTNSEDNRIRTFALPTDLLSENIAPHHLQPYSVLSSPTPTFALTPYPYFSLSDPRTTLVLSSPYSLPIRLSNALYPAIVHTYPLIHAPTERWITPYSLLFTSDGSHFITGSDSLISAFDLTRNGEGPVESFPTVPSKRKKIVGGGVGMKGVISALSTSCDGVLAAGTFNRWIGLYSDQGRGGYISVFPVANVEQLGEDDIGGMGVTQTLWSACGRYLYVVERMSDGILVYDIRVAGRMLGWLKGRKAKTNQRMSVNLVLTADGDHEIWAGGTDGRVRVWKNPEAREGGMNEVRSWKAHDDVVSSAIFHPSGTVLATCSGSYRPPPGFEDDSSNSDTSLGMAERNKHPMQRKVSSSLIDNSLKIWAL